MKTKKRKRERQRLAKVREKMAGYEAMERAARVLGWPAPKRRA